MKVYKRIMDGVAWIEKIIVCITLTGVSVITFVNVLSRFVFHASLSWSEELVINVFVLLTMLGCALSARDGGLVSLSLIFDRLSVTWKKIFSTIIFAASMFFYYIMISSGFQKVMQQIKSGKETFSLRWPEWVFTILLPIGTVFLALHTIEFFVDVLHGDAEFIKEAQAAEKKGGND